MGMEDQTGSPTFPQEGTQPPQTLSVSHLQRKLKDAARKILSLRLEREQLLEMGNRLRAEQCHSKGKCWEQDGRPGHSWGHASGEGRWCHGSATGGQKKKSFLACLPQAWGQREGCRLASQGGWRTEATGFGMEPTRRLRHRAGLHLGTGCPLTHSGHIWKK